jgi:hypothetical protein
MTLRVGRVTVSLTFSGCGKGPPHAIRNARAAITDETGIWLPQSQGMAIGHRAASLSRAPIGYLNASVFQRRSLRAIAAGGLTASAWSDSGHASAIFMFSSERSCVYA